MKSPHTARPPVPSRDWAYFLDVDGTLIDIADTPQASKVDQALLDLLANLYRTGGGAVAVISGRMIADLHNRLQMPYLPMAGLHGLEQRDGLGRLRTHATVPGHLGEIKAALAPVLTRHAGLLLEDKVLTIALHYRQAPALASYVHQLMRKLLRSHGSGLELQCGKCVVEIKPVGADKGLAIERFLREFPFKGRLPVFVGDDLNDEHGFMAVNKLGGVSIKVGGGASCARYRLPNVAAVRRWLEGALKGNT